MDIRFDNIGYFYKENKKYVKSIPDMAELVNIHLKGNMSFEVDVEGHRMIIDTAKDWANSISLFFMAISRGV